MAKEPRLDLLHALEKQTELWNRFEKKPDPRYILPNHAVAQAI